MANESTVLLFCQVTIHNSKSLILTSTTRTLQTKRRNYKQNKAQPFLASATATSHDETVGLLKLAK